MPAKGKYHPVRIFLFFVVASLCLNPNLFLKGLPFNEGAFQNLPDRIYNIKCLKSGYVPLWTPCHFFGNPHAALHQTGFFYPLNLLFYGILPPVSAFKLMSFVDILLAGLFMFLYLRRLGAGSIGAMGGGFVLMISSYFTGHEAHTANHNSVCWVPLLFFFIEGFLQKRDPMNFAGGALAYAFMIFAGYMHTVVMTGFMVLAYCLFYLCLGPNRFRKRLVSVMLAGLILIGGILLSSIQIVTTTGILPDTERSALSYENFSSYYFPFSHWPMLLFPMFFGAHETSPFVPGYRGADNMAEISGWIGVTPVILAVFGFLLRSRGRRRHAAWAWSGIIFLSTLLCFGPQLKLYRLMYHVPLYHLFKGAAKNWMNVHIGIAILSGWGVHSLLVLSERKPRVFSRMARILAGSVLAIGAGMALYIAILHHTEIRSWSHTQFTDIRNQIKPYLSWRNPAIWIPIIVVLTNGTMLLFWALTRSRYFIYTLILTLTVSTSFTKKQSSRAPENMDLLLKHPEKNRVLSLIRAKEKRLDDYRIFPVGISSSNGTPETLRPLINSLYGVRSLSGYGPLFIKQFAAFFGMVSVGTINKPEYFIHDNRLFSLLNVKYFILMLEDQDAETLIQAFETTDTLNTGWSARNRGGKPYQKIFDDGKIVVYENLNVLPRAHGIRRLQYLAGNREPDKARVYTMWKMQMLDTPYDPRETAFLSEPIPHELNRDFSEAAVSVTPEGPNIIKATVESKGESFVVFAEHYIPGWHCKIDKKKIPIFRTNAVLMGIKVPAGNHAIELYYLPKHFIWGAVLSGIGLIGLLGMLFIPFRSSVRKTS